MSSAQPPSRPVPRLDALRLMLLLSKSRHALGNRGGAPDATEIVAGHAGCNFPAPQHRPQKGWSGPTKLQPWFSDFNFCFHHQQTAGTYSCSAGETTQLTATDGCRSGSRRCIISRVLFFDQRYFFRSLGRKYLVTRPRPHPRPHPQLNSQAYHLSYVIQNPTPAILACRRDDRGVGSRHVMNGKHNLQHIQMQPARHASHRNFG